MNRKRKLHDGIVGAIVATGTALGYWIEPTWLLVPGVIGLLMVQSGFTGFCPVYFLLERLGFSDGPAPVREGT